MNYGKNDGSATLSLSNKMDLNKVFNALYPRQLLPGSNANVLHRLKMERKVDIAK
jgi:hypothetical protein